MPFFTLFHTGDRYQRSFTLLYSKINTLMDRNEL